MKRHVCPQKRNDQSKMNNFFATKQKINDNDRKCVEAACVDVCTMDRRVFSLFE